MSGRNIFLALLVLTILLGVGANYPTAESRSTDHPQTRPTPRPNRPPVIESLSFNRKSAVIPCSVVNGYAIEETEECPGDGTKIEVTTAARDEDGDALVYKYDISAGRIVEPSTGAKVVWDLTGVQPGTYTISVDADDGCGFCANTVTRMMNVERCDCPMGDTMEALGIVPPTDVKSVSFDKKRVVIPCPYIRGEKEETVCIYNDDMKVEVTTTVSPKNKNLIYKYEVTGGRIIGEGAKIVWDLAGNQPGFYTITVSADGGSGLSGKTLTKTMEVDRGCDCHPPIVCPACPGGTIESSASSVRAGETVTFTAQPSQNIGKEGLYRWTVSGGTIVEGQGTLQIKVRTGREMGGTILTAKLEAEYGPGCPICQTIPSKSILVRRR